MISDTSNSSKNKASCSGAMAAEGILPAKLYNPISSAGLNNLHSLSRSRAFSPRSQSFRDANVNVNNSNDRWSELFLEPKDWIQLGDGWFQATSISSGTSTRCGLHSIIQNSSGQLLVCLYEPRTQEATIACTHINPMYDLEVSLKIMKNSVHSNSIPLNWNFQLIFAFKSINDYSLVTCNLLRSTWILSKIKDGNEIFISESSSLPVKANIFYSVLLQIRGNKVSVDVNGIPIFTSIASSNSIAFNGLVGLQCMGSKFALKGWRIRGIDAFNSNSTAPAGGGGGATNVFIPSHHIIPQQQILVEEEDEESSMILDDNNNTCDLSDLSHISSHMSQSQFYSHVNNDEVDYIDSQSNVNKNLQLQGNSNGSSSNKVIKSLAEIMATKSISNNNDDDYNLSQFQPQSRGYSQPPNAANLSQFENNKSNYNKHVNNEQQGQRVPQFSNRLSLQQPPVNANATVFTRLGADPVPWGGGCIPSSSSSKTNTNVLSGPITQVKQQSSSSSLNDSDNRVNIVMAAMLERNTHNAQIVETVFRDVVQRELGVTFDDIASLETAKRLLNEAVVLPLIMPEFFTGIREPWKGVLLFGPPGTGKTLLAKAVCSLNCSTFFSCSSSSLISKYRGDSEKIVRCLFEAARGCAPAIVFMDEIDALVSSRSHDGEHEASRRLKTELFAQMDGIASSTTSNNGTSQQNRMDSSVTTGMSIMVLATTNCPWDLDEALRRRLEKRIFIPLPDLPARADLYRICLRNIPLGEGVDTKYLAAISEGYSGADVHIVCREASMIPLRRVMQTLSPVEIQNRRKNGTFFIPKVLMEDFTAAIANTRPSVSYQSISKFLAWEKEYGSQ